MCEAIKSTAKWENVYNVFSFSKVILHFVASYNNYLFLTKLFPNVQTLSAYFADFSVEYIIFFCKLYKFYRSSKSHCNSKMDSTDFDSKSYHKGLYILLNILV